MDSRTATREILPRLFSQSRVCLLNYHILIRDTNLWKSWVTHMSINQLSDFSSKAKLQNVCDKVYLLKFRLHSLLSAVKRFEGDNWFRRHQPPLLTICAFMRSLLAFELLKPSFIAWFLMFFSVSHCIRCACWFSPAELLFLVGGWICCWLSDTRSKSSVIKCRLRASRMFGSPLCAMK